MSTEIYMIIKQTKFFEQEFIKDLERVVNRFLALENKLRRIINVQYNLYFDHELNKAWYSCMILYDEDMLVPEGGGALETAQRKGVIIQDNQGAEPV